MTPAGDLRAEFCPDVSPEDARAQCERILSSPEFRAPERARNFLRYIVEETLEGRSGRIKAFSIAIEVFGRDETFDTQNDPVVRIEAGRLRRALERYYLVAGQDDPVLIDIPKGGYVPVFARRHPESLPVVETEALRSDPPAVETHKVVPRHLFHRWAVVAVAVGIVLLGVVYAVIESGLFRQSTVNPSTFQGGPSVLVRPFVDLGGDGNSALYAAGLTEDVLSQIARFKELRIIGSETSRSLPAGAGVADLHRMLGVSYVLEGAVRVFDGRFRVTARVVDAGTSTIIWSNAYEEDLRSGDLFKIEVELANKVATAVAQPYGIIFQADERRTANAPPDDLEAYGCTLRFYGYREVLSAEAHAAVRSCLERAVSLHPTYATAWAMLSYIYLDEDRFGFNTRPDRRPLERALDAARRAVRLDPESVRAHQALMMALFFVGEPEEALRLGAHAYALNANDTEFLGEYGSRLAQAGEWQRGASIIEEALLRNPGNAGFYAGMLGFAAYMQGDVARAITFIRRADLQKFPLYHVIAALIFARAGLNAEAAASRRQFLAMRPRFFDDLDNELAKRNFRPEDRLILTDAAREAGFPVPLASKAGTGMQH
ncbi:MAG: adenylate cyclase [Chelatococcus sp.]|uniref:adenylate cyclase n=1 Tax=Chelatococcus sp. TaxID=1953771 RepID=UPI0025B960AF|nr:adenylate cyclase [Chelatococcus sp.]MBX3536547.1 adenylate cyclase [Chelatococcus sp.]